ncbi:MAG: ComEC/Rec2-related protein [candidate division TM6 bacterium GW2011_GWE2_42_60]|nr:MAG: ComEC/Rec2-related protein [candidate division TM6 bacterium GW2011_GWE2_42_60]HBY05847.1 hypothetical protein [Candidatus Dependentiae bacterium]
MNFSALRSSFVAIPLHPLYLFTLAFMFGIIWQQSGYWSFLFLIIFALTLLFGAKFQTQLGRGLKIVSLFAALGFFALGALRVQQEEAAFDQFFRSVLYKKCIVTAEVKDLEPDYRREGYCLLTLAVQKLDDGKKLIHLAHPYSFQFSLKNDALVGGKKLPEPGDILLIKTLYFRPPPEGGYRTYLVKERLVGQIQYSYAEISLLSHPQWSWRRFLFERRNAIIDGVRPHLEPLTFTLFASVFLGKKTVDAGDMSSIRDQFRPWGILHYLARSGLHLMILVMLLNKVLSFFPIPYGIRNMLVILLLLVYLLVSWASISFLRAAILSFLYSICVIMRLQIHALYLLVLTCFLVLLVNPLQLFFLDFQLSFLLTGVLAWLNALKRSQKTPLSVKSVN